MFKQFKEFALGGNLIDMATGIIIGAAFGTVVKSLVDNIIMPPIGKLMGGVDFSKLFYDLSGEGVATLAEAEEKGLSVVKYGQFIQDFFSFIVIALTIFILIKKVMKSKEEEDAGPSEADLLTEIRDLLAK